MGTAPSALSLSLSLETGGQAQVPMQTAQQRYTCAANGTLRLHWVSDMQHGALGEKEERQGEEGERRCQWLSITAFVWGLVPLSDNFTEWQPGSDGHVGLLLCVMEKSTSQIFRVILASFSLSLSLSLFVCVC